MHIHGQMNPINPYSDAAEKAIAALRAANVRKKLNNSAAEIEGSNSEEVSMIGQWINAAQGHSGSRAEEDDEYQSGSSAEEADFS